jgi:phosphate transport system permease protein
MTPRSQSLFAANPQIQSRKRADARFRLYGLAAILAGLVLLAVLLGTVFSNGLGAFQQSYLTLEVELLESKLDKNGNRDIEEIKKVTTFGYDPLLTAAAERLIETHNIQTDLRAKDIAKLLSKSAVSDLRDFVVADPSRIGSTVSFDFLVNARVDGYLKGRVTRASIADDNDFGRTA